MEHLPLDEQNVRIEEMSLYGDDVSFKEKTAERENMRQSRVEWKAQFHKIETLVTK